MISEGALPELAAFRRVEKALCLETEPRFGRLVCADDNESRPVHRWFRFKEGFSGHLLAELLASMSDRPTREIRLLDPFCGVGTSLLSAQELSAGGVRIDACGIERNPLIAFVARTKTAWPRIPPSQMLADGARALANASRHAPAIPSLSSVKSGRCVTRYTTRKLLAIRDAIADGPEGAVRNALLLGLASAIERLSRVRKDGRALRIVQREAAPIVPTVTAKWQEMAADILFMRRSVPNPPWPRVVLGDGREPLACGVQPASVDLIVTSPPYPNNIDYSEVYKLELWLLGIIRKRQDFLALRKSTFRSHPTSAFPDPCAEFLDEVRRGKLKVLLHPLLSRTEESPERWRYRLILGYFSDMWTALQQQLACLRKGGRSFVVVGNSLHGRESPYLIPTDLVVARIAQCIGFSVERVVISRSLRRRIPSNHFLRESIVSLRKSDA